MINKVFSMTLLFMVVAVVMITVPGVFELFFGSSLTHPLWDRTFNWGPLLANLGLVSLIGGLSSAMAADIIATRRDNQIISDIPNKERAVALKQRYAN